MYARIFIPPDHSHYFLFGPRGTGKTSWLKIAYPNSVYIDLLRADIFNDLRARPERIWSFVPKGYHGPIIIDEIQKLPALLDEIHSRINEGRNKLQFILTGSNARKLKRAGVNLLAGRLRTQNFYPMLAQELGADFDIKKALRVGMLPEAWGVDDPEQYLESYLQVYIDQEVRLEGIVRNVDDFARFLEAASLSQASVINVSNVASDSAVPRRTVQTYFEILEDLLISYRLPVFQKKAKRELINHDKFYFFDTGLFQTVRPRGVLDTDAEVGGAALETLVFSHIKAINDLKRLKYGIFYWHTKNHIEVDFILYGPNGFFAIEVKSSTTAREGDFKSLRLFKDDYPQAKLLLLYPGPTKTVGDIHAINVEDFLLKIAEYLSGSMGNKKGLNQS